MVEWKVHRMEYLMAFVMEYSMAAVTVKKKAVLWVV
jgi:hypothetical protein